MSSPREMPDADEGPPDGEPDPRADDNLPSGDGGSVPLLCTRKQRQLSTSLHAKAAAAFHSFARSSGGSFPLLCMCRRKQLSTPLHAQSEQHFSASLHAQAEAAFHFFARADSGSFPLLCTRRRRYRSISLRAQAAQHSTSLHAQAAAADPDGFAVAPLRTLRYTRPACRTFATSLPALSCYFTSSHAPALSYALTFGTYAYSSVSLISLVSARPHAHSHVYACSLRLSHLFTHSRAFEHTRTLSQKYNITFGPEASNVML